MSAEQNIPIAQKAYADFLVGNIASLLAILDDNIEWNTPDIGLPNGGLLRGKAGVSRFFQTVAETWNFQAFEPKQYIASDDHVAVRGRYVATSRSTGRTATADWVMTWKFRDGKVTHFQEYTDTAALKDALAARATA